MARSTWKAVERRIARFFGTERTPLSGGASRHTRSDSLSSLFFIESKHRAKWAIFTLFQEVRDLAKKEQKLPLLALHEKGRANFLVCVSSENLGAFCIKFLELLKEMKKKGEKDAG